jgi:transposase InsO family protein
MAPLLDVHGAACLGLIRCLLCVVALDDHRRRVGRRVKGWQRSLRRVRETWLRRRGLLAPPSISRRHRPWNRTPDHIEEQVVRLHVELPQLGAGQLRWLAARVLGFSAARETIRQILIRRRDLVVLLEDERCKKPRRIQVDRARQLWGADLNLVWLLGVVPVWLFGVVDYHGSRLVMTFERMRLWPTAAQIADAFERAAESHGAPERLLTDRAPIFRAAAVAQVLAEHGTQHALIKPCHTWTNGRIERIFRTFKETLFRHCDLWLYRSTSQIDRYCLEFALLQSRPSSWRLRRSDPGRGPLRPTARTRRGARELLRRPPPLVAVHVARGAGAVPAPAPPFFDNLPVVQARAARVNRGVCPREGLSSFSRASGDTPTASSGRLGTTPSYAKSNEV